MGHAILNVVLWNYSSLEALPQGLSVILYSILHEAKGLMFYEQNNY